MSKTFKLAAVAALCACGALSAQAGVTFDANVEADVTHTTKRETTPADTGLGGRVELNANAELLRNGDYFANAKGTLIVPFTGGEAKVDDAWFQFGSSTVDLKLGRFEAADLFPLGMDTVFSSTGVSSGYRANALRGRMTDGRFHGVLGVNAAQGLRFELGVVAEKSTVEAVSGVRPTVVYTAGDLTLRAGVEAVKGFTSTDVEVASVPDYTGFGLSAGYNLSKSLALNVNYAHADKLDSTSLGINAVYNGTVGLGWVQDKTGSLKSDTVYAAYKMPLLGVKNAFVTPALSYSTGTGVDSGTAFRVRFNYAF